MSFKQQIVTSGRKIFLTSTTFWAKKLIKNQNNMA